jgi:hypothetical protein
LDLRGNSGGHPFFAAALLSYLVCEPFTYFQNADPVEEFQPLYEPMSPNKNTFQGDCYVMVDGGVLSTAGHLVSLIRFHQLGIFVGEEPGSSFFCNDMSKKVVLPNTKLEVNIPQKTFITQVAGFKYDQSFPVDYPLSMKIEDLLNGRDTQLQYTYQLILKEVN